VIDVVGDCGGGGEVYRECMGGSDACGRRLDNTMNASVVAVHTAIANAHRFRKSPLRECRALCFAPLSFFLPDLSDNTSTNGMVLVCGMVTYKAAFCGGAVFIARRYAGVPNCAPLLLSEVLGKSLNRNENCNPSMFVSGTRRRGRGICLTNVAL
jgi:hypothetical protein